MNDKGYLTNRIASRAFNLMRDQKLLRPGDRPIFYAWQRADRVILIVDPEMVTSISKVLSPAFRHDLSTILEGRRVVTTNSRGIFLQVGYDLPPSTVLKATSMDLLRQPTPLHVPVGMAHSGELWLSVIEMDSVLIGGSRRMGKTRFLHGWIQALLHGGQARLFLWDGKDGLEFGRYAGFENVTFSNDLRGLLGEIQVVMAEHDQAIKQAGVSSLVEHNERAGFMKLKPIVLMIDELAAVPNDCKGILADLVGRGGAYGVYPVFATTYPGSDEVKSFVKANLSTRIALAVPTRFESQVILGQSGAEKLPKVKGRLLLVWRARLVEVQAFTVDLPEGRIYLGPKLNEQQTALVGAALEAGGRLSISLATQIDRTLTPHLARRLLEEWERRGWLAKDPNQDNARFVTPALREIYAQTTQAAQTAQTPQTGDVSIRGEQS